MPTLSGEAALQRLLEGNKRCGAIQASWGSSPGHGHLPAVTTRVRNQHLLIVGARYDLDSGEVQVFPARMSLEPAPTEMPWQSFGEIRH